MNEYSPSLRNRDDQQEKRTEYAIQKLNAVGITDIQRDTTTITFFWKNSPVKFFPFTGWHTGKTIIDGRGLQNLLKQLTDGNNTKGTQVPG